MAVKIELRCSRDDRNASENAVIASDVVAKDDGCGSSEIAKELAFVVITNIAFNGKQVSDCVTSVSSYVY